MVLCSVGSGYEGPSGRNIPLEIQNAPNVETSVRTAVTKSITGREGDPIPVNINVRISERLTDHVPGGYVMTQVGMVDSSVTTVTFLIMRESGAEKLPAESDGLVWVTPEDVPLLAVKAHDDFSGTFILAVQSVVLTDEGGHTTRVHEYRRSEVTVNVRPVSDGTSALPGGHLIEVLEDAGP